MTTGARRHSVWTLTVLRVLTPLGIRASSWFVTLPSLQPINNWRALYSDLLGSPIKCSLLSVHSDALY